MLGFIKKRKERGIYGFVNIHISLSDIHIRPDKKIFQSRNYFWVFKKTISITFSKNDYLLFK